MAEVRRPNWKRTSSNSFKPAILAFGAQAQQLPNLQARLSSKQRDEERKRKKYRSLTVARRITPERESQREEQPRYAVRNSPLAVD